MSKSSPSPSDPEPMTECHVPDSNTLDDATETAVDNLLWDYSTFMSTSAESLAYDTADAQYETAREALRCRIHALILEARKEGPHILGTLALDLGCKLPPEGWYCSRKPGHKGPCAARSNPAITLAKSDLKITSSSDPEMTTELDEATMCEICTKYPLGFGRAACDCNKLKSGPPESVSVSEPGLTIKNILTPERLAFMASCGGMAIPDIEVETSIGLVTLKIIARPSR